MIGGIRGVTRRSSGQNPLSEALPLPDWNRHPARGFTSVDFGTPQRKIVSGSRKAHLAGCIESLKTAGVRFRDEMESGPGGRRIQIEDPDGNPIELFEPRA
jgi:Glyoxalase/Bleomycin resistance protein/Dioxygenase superfamily